MSAPRVSAEVSYWSQGYPLKLEENKIPEIWFYEIFVLNALSSNNYF